MSNSSVQIIFQNGVISPKFDKIQPQWQDMAVSKTQSRTAEIDKVTPIV